MTHPEKPNPKPPRPASRNPSGHRRRGPEHFASEDAAKAFPGLPEGQSHHELGELLQKVGPTLGWQPRLVHHFRVLLQYTRSQDWTPGARPVVWLSVQETAIHLGVTPSQVRRNEKKLHELGAISWKDSANHRRYGERDENDNIVEAWGIDLSPAAALLDTLREAADQLCSRRAECRQARQQLAGLKQSVLAAINTALETGALQDASAEAYRRLVHETANGHGRAGLRDLKHRLRRLEAIDDDLRRELADGRPLHADDDKDSGAGSGGSSTTPADAIDNPVDNSEFPSDSDASPTTCARPDAPPRLPPYDTTKGTVCENITVASGARRKGKAGSETPGNLRAAPDGGRPDLGGGFDHDTVAGVPVPAFLAMMPDPMRFRVPARGPVWPAIVDAAADIAADIGISRHAWGEACIGLGREAAAIALAVVAVKHERGVVYSPGGYLRQMTRRHAAGELRLAPSVFGLIEERRGPAGDESRRRRTR